MYMPISHYLRIACQFLEFLPATSATLSHMSHLHSCILVSITKMYTFHVPVVLIVTEIKIPKHSAVLYICFVSLTRS